MKLKDLLPKDFMKNLDSNLKLFGREVARELRDEKDFVIAITGYPGYGKSQIGSIIGMLIDNNYKFEGICFIPTSGEIKRIYMGLPMYSYLHVDEASKGLHKHQWYERVQQTLTTLYETERENHYLCTALIMPRFQNFTENFRNFRIKYWINIVERGLAIFYRRDEDKDAKDPWHLEESYKKKLKMWGNKRLFERTLPDIVRMEQKTKNYWFYVRVPEIPKDVWQVYKDLKAKSRIIEKESNVLSESWQERISRERAEKWQKIKALKIEGKSHIEIAAILQMSTETVRRHLRMMEVLENNAKKSPIQDTDNHNIIFNPKKDSKDNKISEEFNII